jgi:hypothetical protein
MPSRCPLTGKELLMAKRQEEELAMKRIVEVGGWGVSVGWLAW